MGVLKEYLKPFGITPGELVKESGKSITTLGRWSYPDSENHKALNLMIDGYLSRKPNPLDNPKVLERVVAALFQRLKHWEIKMPTTGEADKEDIKSAAVHLSTALCGADQWAKEFEQAEQGKSFLEGYYDE